MAVSGRTMPLSDCPVFVSGHTIPLSVYPMVISGRTMPLSRYLIVVLLKFRLHFLPLRCMRFSPSRDQNGSDCSLESIQTRNSILPGFP